MKNLTLVTLLLCAICSGCKKPNVEKMSIKYEVRYNFKMAGTPSKITYKSISENKLIILNDIVMADKIKPYTVKDSAKVGDLISIKMSTTNPVPLGYMVDLMLIKKNINGLNEARGLETSFKVLGDNLNGNYILIERAISEADVN